jgi:hypothetical protein
MVATRLVSMSTLAAALVLATATAAAAQAPPPDSKLELGIFPLGGTFLVGGDDDREVDFNVYSMGGSVSYAVHPRVAVEGELGIGLGLAQDVSFRKATVFHVQMPNVWSYFGNLVVFPRGTAGTALPVYVTAGVGLVSLQSRESTRQFGYDVDDNGWESFIAGNVGGGVKFLRASVPNWGFRADYRYLIVNSNDDAPAFFARAKTRGGHRIYFGLLYRPR